MHSYFHGCRARPSLRLLSSCMQILHATIQATGFARRAQVPAQSESPSNPSRDARRELASRDRARPRGTRRIFCRVHPHMYIKRRQSNELSYVPSTSARASIGDAFRVRFGEGACLFNNHRPVKRVLHDHERGRYAHPARSLQLGQLAGLRQLASCERGTRERQAQSKCRASAALKPGGVASRANSLSFCPGPNRSMNSAARRMRACWPPQFSRAGASAVETLCVPAHMPVRFVKALRESRRLPYHHGCTSISGSPTAAVSLLALPKGFSM